LGRFFRGLRGKGMGMELRCLGRLGGGIKKRDRERM